jgi:hypothetical protein
MRNAAMFEKGSRLGAVALLALTAACDPSAADGNAAAPVAHASVVAAAAVENSAAPVATPAVAAAQAGAACPAALSAGQALPAGSRLVGAPLGAEIKLSWASVTADAPEAISDEVSGMAELEADENAEQLGMAIDSYFPTVTPEEPHTLVCRYGASKQPLLAESVLLVPIPASAKPYDCIVEVPQGEANGRVSRAWCKPE